MHNKFRKDTWKTLSCPQPNGNVDADDAELQFQLSKPVGTFLN